MAHIQNTKHDYKDGKYLICIYDTGDCDECIATFDTAQEFADYMQTNVRKAYDILRNHTSGKGKRNDKYIYIQAKRYELHCVRI